MEEKKSGKGLVVCFILSIIIILGLVGYICYDKLVLDKDTSNTITNLKKEVSDYKKDATSVDNTTTEVATVEKMKCSGTYSATGVEGIEGDTTYELNNDGTFVFTSGGIKSGEGVFNIIGNTISITSPKHTTGPVDQDPGYATEDYIIADDCSYIILPVNTYRTTAVKLPKVK